MDWEKYGEHKELFKHMEKCADLINSFEAVEKKEQSLAQRLDYQTTKSAFEWKAFEHAAVNLLDGHNSDHLLALTLDHMKNSGLFEDALSIISKMDQQNYDAALHNLDRFSREKIKKPAYRLETNFVDGAESIYRDSFTNIKEYPPTIDQFREESISLLIGHGINIDMEKVAHTKSIGESLKSMWVNLKDSFKAGFHCAGVADEIIKNNRGK